MRIFILIIYVSSSVLYSQVLQWRTLEQGPVTSGQKQDVWFINANTGWVVGGSIFKTTDGGFTWNTNTAINNGRCICFADSLNGWIGLLQGTNILYRTSNGGLNWNPVTNIPSPVPGGLCGLFAVNSSVIYGCGRWGGPGRFIKSTNGGNTWLSTDMSAWADWLIDVYFFSVDSGLVVGGLGNPMKAVILFTSNGGASWENKFTSIDTGQWGWKISFPTRNSGYVSLERHQEPLYFAKTTNGGMIWEEKLFLQSGYIGEEGIGFANENLGWIGTVIQSSQVLNFETTNGGLNWTINNFGDGINRFRFLSDSLGYAVGKRVYKYSYYPVGIEFVNSKIPDDYVLKQNYPNPFNPETQISFLNPVTSDIKISVFAVSGEEISVLANERFKPGEYLLRWDASQYPSGVYFCKLAAGNYVKTVKMILLK